jgi:hypothetical protein
MRLILPGNRFPPLSLNDEEWRRSRQVMGSAGQSLVRRSLSDFDDKLCAGIYMHAVGGGDTAHQNLGVNSFMTEPMSLTTVHMPQQGESTQGKFAHCGSNKAPSSKSSSQGATQWKRCPLLLLSLKGSTLHTASVCELRQKQASAHALFVMGR